MPINNPKFIIQQLAKYHGDDWWKWCIWVEATESALNEVDYVIYTLHPTFTNPVRKIKDRNSKFLLETEGWGIFTIYARLFLNKGTEIALEHELHLEYPDGTQNVE